MDPRRKNETSYFIGQESQPGVGKRLQRDTYEMSTSGIPTR